MSDAVAVRLQRRCGCRAHQSGAARDKNLHVLIFPRCDRGINPTARGALRQVIEPAADYVSFVLIKIRESRNSFAVRASI